MLLQSFSLLAFTRAMLLFLRFPQVRRVLRALLPPREAASAIESGDIIWAVSASEKHLGPGSTCLASALVAQAMLARHGHSGTLCIGASRDERGSFTAHAWLERGGAVVVGGPASRIAQFVRFENIDALSQ